MENKKEVALDGTATHEDLVVPFNARERAARAAQVPTEVQEFPKAVAHDEKGEPIIAVNTEHEAELRSKLLDEKLDPAAGLNDETASTGQKAGE